MRSTSGRSTVSKVVAIHNQCKQYARQGVTDWFEEREPSGLRVFRALKRRLGEGVSP